MLAIGNQIEYNVEAITIFAQNSVDFSVKVCIIRLPHLWLYLVLLRALNFSLMTLAIVPAPILTKQNSVTHIDKNINQQL